ncbi:MAG: DUF1538 domain-containing protein [Acutalibacter sp.]
MRKNLKAKTLESLSSVIPITAIVLVLSFTLAPEMPVGTLMMFLLGAILLILGMGLFSLGADMAMMPMGDGVGGEVVRMSKKRSIWPVIPLVFLIGAFITMAEPDLQVLANQVPAVPDMIIILTVAAGVGAFLVISVVNTLKERFSLNTLLLFFYMVVFVLVLFVPKEFLAVAFDSGGVTTGPITVPFIMAFGIGVAASHSSGNRSEDSSFGMVALCSIGPVLAVLIMGVVLNGTEISYTPFTVTDTFTSREAGVQFLRGFPEYMGEVALGLLPVVAFFAIFQIFSLHLQKDALIRLVVGIVYTYVGLVLFLTGVNVGFMPAGYYLGDAISKLPYNWVLIPIGMVVGYFIVAAEPAVHVLNKQVEEVTGGAIPQRAMNLCLSIGVAVSVGLAMTRVLTGISILWFLLPGYAVALVLSRKVPKIFTAIAFDSGGVASGPMTATFLLPFAMGACSALGGNVLTDAFGIVAMVAMTPLVAIQCLGAVYQRRLRRTVEVTAAEISSMSSEDIIDFDDV